MNSLTYTVICVALGVVLGMVISRMIVGERVVEREQIVRVPQCGSCNKLREAIEREVRESYAVGSMYHLPIVHLRDGSFRVNWEKLGFQVRIGGGSKSKSTRK